ETQRNIDRSLTGNLICDVNSFWCSCVPGVTDRHDLKIEPLPRPTSGDVVLARQTAPRTVDRYMKVRTVSRLCAQLSCDPPWLKVRLAFNLEEVNTRMKTHKLVTTEADIVYDVRGPLPTADGRPPLFMIAQ